MNKASKRTRDNLKGVNEKLVMLAGYALAISEQDFLLMKDLEQQQNNKNILKQVLVN